MRASVTLSLPREPASVTRARHVLTTLLSLTDAVESCCGHLAVLISEACANAVLHGDPDSVVDVAIVIEGGVCLIEVGNGGRTPDGGAFDAPIPGPLVVGGRGLPLMAALADTAAFVAGPPDRVRLRLTKQLIDG